MSYFMMSRSESHSHAAESGAPGLVSDALASPLKTWMCPLPLAPPPYSARSTPMRLKRHSSESAPVEMAMLGRSPSLPFLGSVSVRSGTAVLVHGSTLGRMSCRRHLPTWMTSGMPTPSGASWMTNPPVASVTAEATGSPV